MEKKTLSIAGIVIGIACVLVGVFMVLSGQREDLVRSERRRILDSVAYAQKADSLAALRAVTQQELQVLQERFDTLTLALDEYEKRLRGRKPTRSRNADSVATAILRAAGLFHPGTGERHP